MHTISYKKNSEHKTAEWITYRRRQQNYWKSKTCFGRQALHFIIGIYRITVSTTSKKNNNNNPNQIARPILSIVGCSHTSDDARVSIRTLERWKREEKIQKKTRRTSRQWQSDCQRATVSANYTLTQLHAARLVSMQSILNFLSVGRRAAYHRMFFSVFFRMLFWIQFPEKWIKLVNFNESTLSWGIIREC